MTEEHKAPTTKSPKAANSNKRSKLLDKKAAIEEKYKKQLLQLDAQIQAHEAREKEKRRKIDTRQKIIIGGLARMHMQKNPNSDFAKKMIQLMDEYIIFDKDRALFDMSPLPKEDQEVRRKSHALDRKRQDDIESF